MDQSSSQKKNKKKKADKSSNVTDSVLSSQLSTLSIADSKSCENKKVSCNNKKESCCNINENLPNKVGMKTVFKDVEVTMTSDQKNETATGKKKKKKKSKQSIDEVPEKASSSTKSEKVSNFLKFSGNSIELVNHPEISVTVSSAEKGEETTKKDPVAETVPSVKDQTQSGDGEAAPAPKKKKKKKKKKAGQNGPSVSETVTAPAEPAPATPKYVKLPSTDNSCVLLVSHDNFSNGNNSVSNDHARKLSDPKNGINIVSLLNGKNSNENIPKNVPVLNPPVQIGGSISIFPVNNAPKEGDSQQKLVNVSRGLNLESAPNAMKNENSTLPKSTVSNTMGDTANDEGVKLSKAQLKAERRAKQEAQRAAKLAKTAEKSQADTKSVAKEIPLAKKDAPETSSEKSNCQNAGLMSSNTTCKEPNSEKTKLTPEKDELRKVRLFSHLPHYKLNFSKQLSDKYSKIHPSILQIGSQYSNGVICGSNARCIAFLGAFRETIKDSSVPPGKNFGRDLESKLQLYLNFLSSCRPLSVSMVNAIKFLKHQISHIPEGMAEDKVKESLCDFINNFVNEEILLAKEAIGNSASSKIVNGDVVLVFGFSSVVKDVLYKAYNQNKDFHVLVIDSRPRLEGHRMLHYLVKQGLSCSYVPINAVSYVMKEVSKVIIGAHALLSNGCVMSRLGCKQIALVAAAYSVPVLVCCETYKFCERVLTDSFVHNELDNPELLVNSNLVKNESLKNWQDLNSLQILHLLYDVTPPDLISMVITEKGVLPCTSVPVVLRVRHAGLHE